MKMNMKYVASKVTHRHSLVNVLSSCGGRSRRIATRPNMGGRRFSNVSKADLT